MALPQFRESTVKRFAYALTLSWVLMGLSSLFNDSFAWVAAFIGFPAGIWMGRLTEARENAKGNGVVLGK